MKMLKSYSNHLAMFSEFIAQMQLCIISECFHEVSACNWISCVTEKPQNCIKRNFATHVSNVTHCSLVRHFTPH